MTAGLRRLVAIGMLATTPAVARQQAEAQTPTPTATPTAAQRRGAVGIDTTWRGSFTMVERLVIDADTSEQLDGPRRRAAVGMQVNLSRASTLRSARTIRLDGTLVPRFDARGDVVQRARIVASYRAESRGTEFMPTRVRCTTNGAEQQTTIVRTMESASRGSADVEDEVTVNAFGIEVLGPRLVLQSRQLATVTGDDVCGVPGAPDQRDAFEHEQELERYAVVIAPDPRRPNVSVGSKVERFGPVTRTWTWAFVRGPATPGLAIERVTFEHHVFPDATGWQAVGPAGTVDGNVVRVRVTVRNDGDRQAGDLLRLTDLAASRALPGGSLPVSVPARGTSTVELLWDTHGWAWEPGLRGQSARRIEARLANGAPGADAVVIPLVVAPRPVVLVHGLWSDATTWRAYGGFLAESHSFAWRAFAVGDGQVGDPAWRLRTGVLAATSLFDETNSIFVNANLLARYVAAVRTQVNAWHVDLVGHSMGGLISRLYLTMAPKSIDDAPVVRNLMMLGTPNLGSPCSLPLDLLSGGDVEAYRQLTPQVADAFNGRVRDVPGVRYAILAGAPLPKFPCADGPLDFTPNDGVVSVPSAFAWYHDRARSTSLHTDMTGSPDDFRRFVLPRLAIAPDGGEP